MRPSEEMVLNYATAGEPADRCPSAHPGGFRCARLPVHGGRCVAITDEGALSRFAYREPHPDQVIYARAAEHLIRGGVIGCDLEVALTEPDFDVKAVAGWVRRTR